MKRNQQLTDIKERINTTIRRNTYRGFISYSGCNQICSELYAIIEVTETHSDQREAFDIYVMILLKMIKLISHADTSSGSATDVIQDCLDRIDKLCLVAAEENHRYFFDTIVKTARNKAFQEWPDGGYGLLRSAVYFIHDRKQAQKILDIIPLLGNLYDGSPYPDQLLITLAIIERLDGAESADQYLMDHIDVPEMRMVAVDKAFATKHYLRVEKLCREAIKQNIRGHWRPPWVYYLERLYAETNNQEKLLETIRLILFQRDTSYFSKLKEAYQQKNIWEEQREPLWRELSKVLPAHEYASLLAQEGEVEKLLEVVRQAPSYVLCYGKQLAGNFPEETYAMYEEHILEEAKEATDRRKYKQICLMIKEFSTAGAKEKAIELIDRLTAMYSRRPAMLEELLGLKKRLEKG